MCAKAVLRCAEACGPLCKGLLDGPTLGNFSVFWDLEEGCASLVLILTGVLSKDCN